MEWTIDNSLTVVGEDSVKSGEKSEGCEVEDLFRKKLTKLQCFK